MVWFRIVIFLELKPNVTKPNLGDSKLHFYLEI